MRTIGWAQSRTVGDARCAQPAPHGPRDREQGDAGRADRGRALQCARQARIGVTAVGMREAFGFHRSPVGILACPIPPRRPRGPLQAVGMWVCRPPIGRPRRFGPLQPRELPRRHAGIGFRGGRLAIATFGVLNSHRWTQRHSSPGESLHRSYEARASRSRSSARTARSPSDGSEPPRAVLPTWSLIQ